MQSTIPVRVGDPGVPLTTSRPRPTTGRAVARRDEFGPVRGRPFGLDTPPARPAVVEGPLGHRLSRRGAVAWEAAW